MRTCGGPEVPTHLQGFKILGTPVGHPDLPNCPRAPDKTLLDRIPLLKNVQATWLLFLYCAFARANNLVRVVEPVSAREFCTFTMIECGNAWRPSCRFDWSILRIEEAKSFGSLPMVLGGIVLRSAARTSKLACEASWSDSLAMIRHAIPPWRTSWCETGVGRGHGIRTTILTRDVRRGAPPTQGI